MARRLRLLACLLAAQGAVGSAWAQPTDVPLPAANTTEFPAGITVAKVEGGQVYVDAHGRTLYGLDLRTVNRWSVDPSKYCSDRCEGWEPLLAPPGSKPNLNIFRGFRRGPAGAARPPAAPAAPPAGASATAGAGAATAGGQANSREAQLAAAVGFGAAPPGTYNQQNAPDWTIIEGPAGPQYVYKGYHMVYVRAGDKPRSTAFDGAEGKTWNTLKFVPPVPKLTARPGSARPSSATAT